MKKKKGKRRKGYLPKVGVAEITGTDNDGELIAAPQGWNSDEYGPAPNIIIAPGSNAGVGDRVLARYSRIKPKDEIYDYEARIIKQIGKARETIFGIFRKYNGEGSIEPVDKKRRTSFPVAKGDEADARPGELVTAELTSRTRYGPPNARITGRHGGIDAPRSFSLIAIETHGLPHVFPDSVTGEVQNAKPPDLKDREDLRHIPFITIDPDDARDHDDAVYAEPDNSGGFTIMVAIADVAHYVRPGSNLDREALKRGNSVYFPDLVIPMLPERISNDLCSLREGEDRPTLIARMTLNQNGKKTGYRFVRAIIRSHAKLSYNQAQTAIDGTPDEKTAPLLEPVLKPLWAAYRALAKARDARQPLDLDLPERKIRLDDEGNVKAILTPDRLDAHRLVEEFMIQANISAAETLEKKRFAALYRIHEAPSREKLIALAEFLQTIGIKLAKGQHMKPEHFNAILAQVKGSENAELVGEVVLRSQAQAIYSAENLGHFGLNLRRYSHFTSPIRRYADLIIHRLLISALGFGPDGMDKNSLASLEAIAEEISNHERRAMAAERDTIDRLIASFMQERIGAHFEARISGVTRAGLFVRLAETGADGLVPISKIPGDYYYHDERRHTLTGESTGRVFRLGDEVEVRLAEAAPVRGALRFELLDSGKNQTAKPRPKLGRVRRKKKKRR